MQHSANSGKRIAFFGGSFDPPHLGHLAVARAARAALGLDRMLFAPVGAQPLKPAGLRASFEDRLAMTELAIAGEREFEVSLADAPLLDGAPNYTLTTLLGLRAGLSSADVLYFLIGADSFMNLRHWFRAAEIPFTARLVVASRPGEPLSNLAEALPDGIYLEAEPVSDSYSQGVRIVQFRLHNMAEQSTFLSLLPGLHYEVSASLIRERSRIDETGPDDLLTFVPQPVADYIRLHRLYGSLAPSATSD